MSPEEQRREAQARGASHQQEPDSRTQPGVSPEPRKGGGGGERTAERPTASQGRRWGFYASQGNEVDNYKQISENRHPVYRAQVRAEFKEENADSFLQAGLPGTVRPAGARQPQPHSRPSSFLTDTAWQQQAVSKMKSPPDLQGFL